MQMQTAFQFLHSIGVEMLYTDTDAIVFKATKKMWKLFSDKFVPVKKAFGSFTKEGPILERFVVIGPKNMSRWTQA